MLTMSDLRYFSRSSVVLLNSQVCISFIYFVANISDELVMSRENSKISIYTFCKSEALQFGIRAVCSEDLRLDLSVGWRHTEL